MNDLDAESQRAPSSGVAPLLWQGGEHSAVATAQPLAGAAAAPLPAAAAALPRTGGSGGGSSGSGGGGGGGGSDSAAALNGVVVSSAVAAPAVSAGASGAAAARGANKGCFARGQDDRRRARDHEPRRASSKNGRAVAHSRGMGQLCKAAVDGSIRGQGTFVLVSFSEAGNVNYFSTSEDAGIETRDWADPELQRWLESREKGTPFASSRATVSTGLSAESAIMGQRGDEQDEQRQQEKRRRTNDVSAQRAPATGTIAQLAAPTDDGTAPAVLSI